MAFSEIRIHLEILLTGKFESFGALQSAASRGSKPQLKLLAYNANLNRLNNDFPFAYPTSTACTALLCVPQELKTLAWSLYS